MKSICILALVVVMAVAVSGEWKQPQPLTGPKTTLPKEEFDQLAAVYRSRPETKEMECKGYAKVLRSLLDDQTTNNEDLVQFGYNLLYYTKWDKTTLGEEISIVMGGCLDDMPEEWLKSTQ